MTRASTKFNIQFCVVCFVTNIISYLSVSKNFFSDKPKKKTHENRKKSATKNGSEPEMFCIKFLIYFLSREIFSKFVCRFFFFFWFGSVKDNRVQRFYALRNEKRWNLIKEFSSIEEMPECLNSLSIHCLDWLN